MILGESVSVRDSLGSLCQPYSRGVLLTTSNPQGRSVLVPFQTSKELVNGPIREPLMVLVNDL